MLHIRPGWSLRHQSRRVRIPRSLSRDGNDTPRGKHPKRPHLLENGRVFSRNVFLPRIETSPEKQIPDPDHRSANNKKKTRGILEPVVRNRRRHKPRSAQLVREIVVAHRVDMAGCMNRIGAGQQQRIEQRRETGMEIPPAGIEIEDVRRADDCQSSGPKNSMELSREGELILDVLDHFKAARHID